MDDRTLPPLPPWIRLLAVAQVEAGDAPRLEAHLMFRASVGMRPGPVHRRLCHLSAERVEAVWSVLRDLAHADGPPNPRAAEALRRAGIHLRTGWGKAPVISDHEEGGVGARSRKTTPAGPSHHRSAPRSTVPEHVLEAFLEWVAGSRRGDRIAVGVLGYERPVHSILRSVAASSEPLPAEVRKALGLAKWAMYRDAARLVMRSLGGSG
jgi:hypothetical protein